MKNIQNNEKELLKEFISKNEGVLDILPTRGRQVIELRLGLFDGWERTHKQVGEIFNISRTRAAQIEARAKYKIQEYTGVY